MLEDRSDETIELFIGDPVVNNILAISSVAKFESLRRMNKDQNGFSLAEIILLFLVIVGVAGVGIIVWNKVINNKTKSNSNISSNTNQTSNANDHKTEQALAQITNTVDNYPNNSANGLLPDNLMQLGLKDITVSSYTYNVIEQPSGGPNAYEYHICADFDTSTYSSNAYSNYVINQLGVEANGQHISTQFSVHSKGQQCFDVTESDPNNGPVVSIVRNNSEK